MPKFDFAAAAGLSAAEVRKRWPRFLGTCPTCNMRVLLYESMQHYIAGGDW